VNLCTGMSSSAVGYLHSPNYDWFAVRYTAYVPGYYNASVFAPLCEGTQGLSMPSPIKTAPLGGGFDAALFGKDLAAEPHRLYQPLTKSIQA
jgi:hypothetical protein